MPTLVQTFEMVSTYCAPCGFPFMVPQHFKRDRQENGREFFCPSCGRKLHYSGTELDRTKQKLLQAERQAEAWMRDYDREHEARVLAENRRRAAAGQITKLRKRVGNGVCPCCNRSFQNLRRHMEAKHPEFAEQAEEGRA